MQEQFDTGDGFRACTKSTSNELVVHLSPALAHEVGAMIWRHAPRDTFVDDPRLVFAAALCNLSEHMDLTLLGN
jgi:hypothetical protein